MEALRARVLGPPPPPTPPPGEFFNHCCDPNAWWADDFRLVARRPIAADEEITYDYCTEDMDVSEFACGCGAAACRNFVRKTDWALPALAAAAGLPHTSATAPALPTALALAGGDALAH